MFGKRKGQSTLEYALIIAVVVGAFLAMQYYVSRGLQGKLRESIDDISQGGQYAAGNTTSTVQTSQQGNFSTIETTNYQSGASFRGTYVNYTEVPTSLIVNTTVNESITRSFGDERLFD